MQKRIILIILISVLLSAFAIIFVAANLVKAPGSDFSAELNTDTDKIAEENKNKFSDFSRQKKSPQSFGKEAVLFAAGDISYSRGVGRVVKRQGNDEYPFLKTGAYIKGADLAFANLETTITPGREIADFEMVFRSDPGLEKVLRDTGFSVLSLANNHIPDFGEKGISDTIAYLDAVGIKHAGAGENALMAGSPAFLEAGGYRFAFLAYNDSDVVPPRYSAGENRAGTALMRIDEMVEAVRAVRAEVDFVIVSMHSGTEYVKKPNASQTAFARAAIDAGAETVIGHHPHVIQTMEKYQGKYIFYSLGNFVFDQPWSENTKDSLMIKAYFTENGINKIEFMPATMKNFAQPEAVFGDEAEGILERLEYRLEYRDVYFWNSGQKNFQTRRQAMLYSEDFQNPNPAIKTELADLDKDLNEETYFLKNGVLEIRENSALIWQSPPEWWIDSFDLADSNNDGRKNLNLSLWRVGSFGPSKPFWSEGDAEIGNHFFVYEFIEKKMKQLWGSSALSAPNCEFVFGDINGDGESELIVIEGDYAQKPNCHGEYIAVWKWNGWGFANEWRSEKGNFSGLELLEINGEVGIAADIK